MSTGQRERARRGCRKNRAPPSGTDRTCVVQGPKEGTVNSLSLLSFPSPLAPHCPTILTRGCPFHHLGQFLTLFFSRPFYELSSLFPRYLCNVYSSAPLDKNSFVVYEYKYYPLFFLLELRHINVFSWPLPFATLWTNGLTERPEGYELYLCGYSCVYQ